MREESNTIMRKLQLSTVFLGGFVGPFAGQSIAVILPNVASTFDISLEQAAFTMSVYLFPFATVMLVSTRFVRRFRPRRVILTAYAVTLLGAVACLLADTWPQFLLGFLLLGLANAFTLPVFQVMLHNLSPPERLGSSLGTYAAMQALGLFSAPLVSGLAARLDWQLVYLIVIAAGLWILVIGVPDIPPPVAGENGRQRISWWPAVIHMVTCLMIGFSIIGIGILTALSIGDRFGIDEAGTGLVVMCGGLAAFIFARTVGGLADRHGGKIVLTISCLTGASAVALLPVVPAPWLVAACWALAVVSAQGIQTSINIAVLRAPGGNSLISTVQAFRFYGSSFTPVVMLPVYLGAMTWSFWIPAVGLLAVLGLQLTSPAWRYSRD